MKLVDAELLLLLRTSPVQLLQCLWFWFGLQLPRSSHHGSAALFARAAEELDASVGPAAAHLQLRHCEHSKPAVLTCPRCSHGIKPTNFLLFTQREPGADGPEAAGASALLLSLRLPQHTGNTLLS